MPLLNLSVSQFLWVFIATNLLIKLKSGRLFLRWLASGGLACYKIPTNDQLRPLKCRAGGGGGTGGGDPRQRTKSKGAKPSQPGTSDDRLAGPNEFRIRSADLTKLTLNKVDIDSGVLLTAPYGEHLDWVASLACMSLISFILTQILFIYSPRTHEYNFSLVWIMLVITQCLLILSQLTAIYFKNQVSIGERSLCIVSGCLFLLVAMIVLALDGPRLELMVTDSLATLSRPTTSLTTKHTLLDPEDIEPPPLLPTGQATRPASMILVKLAIAVICSLAGVIITFPGLRYGQLHESILANVTTSRARKIQCYLNYLSPILIVCLWIPAISRNLLKKIDRLPFDDDQYDSQYEILRISLCLLVGIGRMVAVRGYVQTFLLSGANRLVGLRYRGGMVTNKEVQVSIASMNNYANVVCLQYLLPSLLCLFTSIMYATVYFYNKGNQLDESSVDAAGSPMQLASLRFLFGNDQQALLTSAEETLHRARQLVSSDLIKNMLGFAVWWFHFAWSCTTTVGVVYHKYFTH